MTYHLVDSPPHSRAAKLGFPYAIQINKKSNGWYSLPGCYLWQNTIEACQKRLGKPYAIGSKRPGKKRKWFTDERATFARVYFRTEAARFLVILDMR